MKSIFLNETNGPLSYKQLELDLIHKKETNQRQLKDITMITNMQEQTTWVENRLERERWDSPQKRPPPNRYVQYKHDVGKIWFGTSIDLLKCLR